ncbi:MAG: patatin-like phospholipase family protein [Elainellaceae cyanobacterium]
MNKIRILSLDGGGMRGIITARLLLEVEKYLGAPLNQHFNLIAGTSTGSLLAAGLAIGMRVQDLIDLYKNEGTVIFPYRGRFHLKRLPVLLEHGVSAPKFSNDGLIRTVKKHIGYDAQGNIRYLSDVVPQNRMSRLVITSYDTHSRNAIVFKSWRKGKWYNSDTVVDSETGEKNHLALWEACVSSASAPTFLPPVRIDAALDDGTLHEYSLIDGGVCANNPTACAVAEAIRLLCDPNPDNEPGFDSRRRVAAQTPAQALQNIKVLSIGTGDVTDKMLWNTVRKWGLVKWGLRISDVLMDAPSDVHDYVSRQIISDPYPQDGVDTQYLRLQLDRHTLERLDRDSLSVNMDDARPKSLQLLENVAALYLQEKAVAAQVVEGWQSVYSNLDVVKLYLDALYR